MSLIELTIDTNYLPDWGVQEGLRELLQNTKDAEVSTGFPAYINYKPNKVTLVNNYAKINRDVLLFGKTTKVDDERMIGHFGEGMKLGILSQKAD